MTNEQRMLELAERCEAADLQEDGCYVLDADIARALGWTYRRREETGTWRWAHPTNEHHIQSGPPRYTSSLDAAMTLVPEHGVTSLATEARWRSPKWTWGINDSHGVTHFGNAATAALALCAASLKAQSTDTSEGRDQ